MDLQKTPAQDSLTTTEQLALAKFERDRADGRDFPLAPQTCARLFELYLNGRSSEEIQRDNPQFDLGQVVHAAVDGDWERRRAEHLERLFGRVRERAMQVHVESVEYMADVLSAAHKLNGRRIRKFLQSGDEKDLGDLNISSLDQYRKAAEILMKLTGQEKKQIGGEVTHRHVVEAAREPVQVQQSQLLAALAADAKGSK